MLFSKHLREYSWGELPLFTFNLPNFFFKSPLMSYAQVVPDGFGLAYIEIEWKPSRGMSPCDPRPYHRFGFDYFFLMGPSIPTRRLTRLLPDLPRHNKSNYAAVFVENGIIDT